MAIFVDLSLKQIMCLAALAVYQIHGLGSRCFSRRRGSVCFLESPEFRLRNRESAQQTGVLTARYSMQEILERTIDTLG